MPNFVNQLENLLRSTKERTKIFFLGNTLEDASEILCAFGFIPETWGIFKQFQTQLELLKPRK